MAATGAPSHPIIPPLGQAPFVDTATGRLTIQGLQLLQQYFSTLSQLNNNILFGTGGPNGSVVGSPGNLYLNSAGGASTTLYVKESGTNTKTGWVGK